MILVPGGSAVAEREHDFVQVTVDETDPDPDLDTDAGLLARDTPPGACFSPSPTPRRPLGPSPSATTASGRKRSWHRSVDAGGADVDDCGAPAGW
jgi:hypothetical protein